MYTFQLGTSTLLVAGPSLGTPAALSMGEGRASVHRDYIGNSLISIGIGIVR